jgi:hypothetical protein
VPEDTNVPDSEHVFFHHVVAAAATRGLASYPLSHWYVTLAFTSRPTLSTPSGSVACGSLPGELHAILVQFMPLALSRKPAKQAHLMA